MFAVTYLSNFPTAGLEPAWVRYGGVPTCCPDAQWDKLQVTTDPAGLRIRNTRQPDGKYLSGGVSMGKMLSQTYGRWRFRMRMDAGLGIKMCALLWQTAPNPAPPDHAYEVDFAESSSADALRTRINATVHSPPGNTQTRVAPLQIDFTQWHTFGVTWLPTSLRYTVDGHTWGLIQNPPLAASPMHLAIQTTSGLSGGFGAAPDASTPDEVDLQVAWVKVWSAS